MVYEHLSRLYHRDEVRWKEEYERRSSSPMKSAAFLMVFTRYYWHRWFLSK